ncbi:MAG: two-component regulator propeller domain-containing protein [Bacteroidales bacterium]
MAIFRYLAFISFLIGLSTQSLISQTRYSIPEEYSIINGLPNNEIRCIHKDSKGYIWIGTLYGLAKYDGNKFTVFKHESNSNSISGDVITTIFEDNKGNILIGANGLSILERKTGRWKNYLHNPNDQYSIGNSGISSIAQENDSIYWIITYNGINRFNINTGQFTALNFHPNSRSFYSKIIEVIPHKSIFFRISSTFYKYNLNTNVWKEFHIDNHFEYNNINIFKNNIIGTRQANANVYRLAKVRLDSNEEEFVININGNNCALFNDNNNLFLINDHRAYLFDKDFKIVDNILFQTQSTTNKSKVEYLCGLKEKNGTIWIGTSEGLLKISPQSPFNIIENNNGLPNSYIRSLTVDNNNNLLIGVKQGPVYEIPEINYLSKNRINTIKNIEFPNREGTAYATNQILELKNGNLLFITQDTIYHYNTTLNKFTDKLHLKNNKQYFSALEIADGVLIGSLEKPTLFKISIKSNKIKLDTSFKIKNISDVVYTIYKDNYNRIWVGGEGLYRLTFSEDSCNAYAESIIPSTNERNYTNNSIWNILEIDKNRLMVCTTTNGFYFYDTNTNSFQHFNENNGLPTDFTCAVLKDHNQNLWVSTKEGITYIDSKNFNFKNYTIKCGPFNCDFNFKCCAKTNNNILLFGSKQGIVYFNPDSIKQDISDYPLLINEFRVFDNIVRSELSDKDTIVLKHDENFFTFEFSLLDYRNSKEIRYKYQLLKYNKKERIVSDGANIASYTDVPPGKYCFRLTGFNSTETSNQKTIEVIIIIQPAFYQTTLFKAAIILILLGIVVAILLFYIRRQVLRGRLYKMELDLLRAQINPHFIFNTLTSIQHTILMSSKNVAVDHLAKFSRLMRMCLDYSRIDYIPLEKALQFYTTYVSVESVNLDEEIDFQIKLDETIDPCNVEISPMLIQPFIENAIIHGLATKNKDMELLLSIKRTDEFLTCTIQDNGIGRKKAEEIVKKKASGHKSMGIEISKKSILLQMKSKIFSQDSLTITDDYDENGNPSGTTVNLNIPYKLNH